MDASVVAEPNARLIPPDEAVTDGWSADPLQPVVDLGRRASTVGLIIGLLFALATHGAVSVRAVTSLVQMQQQVKRMRDALHEHFWATYDIEVEQKRTERPEEQPPQPEPEPEPPPLPEPEAPEQVDDPYEDEPPPPPAEASEILTAPEDPNEPVDLTGDGFVSGKGTGPTYGYVSAAGTATKPTFNRHAQVGGVEGGRGKGPPKPPMKPRKSRARPAGIVGSHSWNCPFPPEADIEQIDRATAVLVVTVSTSGRPTSVRIISDPGYGFGRAARQCAMARTFKPALDRDGRPMESTTPPINVRFRR